jgi:hypothetical protein
VVIVSPGLTIESIYMCKQSTLSRSTPLHTRTRLLCGYQLGLHRRYQRFVSRARQWILGRILSTHLCFCNSPNRFVGLQVRASKKFGRIGSHLESPGNIMWLLPHAAPSYSRLFV